LRRRCREAILVMLGKRNGTASLSESGLRHPNSHRCVFNRQRTWPAPRFNASEVSRVRAHSWVYFSRKYWYFSVYSMKSFTRAHRFDGIVSVRLHASNGRCCAKWSYSCSSRPLVKPMKRMQPQIIERESAGTVDEERICSRDSVGRQDYTHTRHLWRREAPSQAGKAAGADAGTESPTPRCPSCGSKDTRRSRRSTLSLLAGIVGLHPFRCRVCRKRFHRRGHGNSAALTP
jgi:hypothetical protein